MYDILLKNLMENLSEIKAAAIVDRDGLIIHSVLRDPNTEDDIIGSVTAVFDSFIKRIKTDFGSAEDFLNVMTVDQNKFVFAAAGSQAIFTIIASLSADDNKLKVFTSHVAKKIALIVDGEEVDTSIPPIVETLANMRSGKLPIGLFSIKVIILGDPLVGKTSLIRRFVDNKFADSYISTIGVDISRKEVFLSEECKITLTIWDVGGQAQSMAPYRKRFYQGAEQAFIQFDVTRRKTFENVDVWIEDLKKSVEKKIPIVLIANKMDLPDHEVTFEEIQAKAKEYDCPYILTSAKTGSNVDDAFRYTGYKFCESI